MNTHSLKTMLCRGALAIGLAACGGGAEVLVIPLFTFGFSGTTTAGQQVTLDLEPNDPTTESGSFTRAELSVDGTITQYTGTWSRCTLRLTLSVGEVLVAPAASDYDGRFQGASTIVLTPGSAGPPTLTVQRRVLDPLPRPSPC